MPLANRSVTKNNVEGLSVLIDFQAFYDQFITNRDFSELDKIMRK